MYLLFEKFFTFTFTFTLAGLENSMIPKVMIRPGTQVRHRLKDNGISPPPSVGQEASDIVKVRPILGSMCPWGCIDPFYVISDGLDFGLIMKSIGYIGSERNGR